MFMYNHLMCFFTEPGIIPKKHEKYYTKVDVLSIDNEPEKNSVFIFKFREKSHENLIGKDENQSLNTVRVDFEKTNTTSVTMIEQENLNYPEIYK